MNKIIKNYSRPAQQARIAAAIKQNRMKTDEELAAEFEERNCPNPERVGWNMSSYENVCQISDYRNRKSQKHLPQ